MALFWDRFLRRSEFCHHAITWELKGPEVPFRTPLAPGLVLRPFFAVSERVEHVFYPVRSSQFVVNAQQRRW